MQERLRTISQQIMSQTRLEQVIWELDLLADVEDKKAVETYIKKMRLNIRIEVKGNDAFMVSYADKDPRIAMLVTNKLASLFIQENIKVRVQHAIATTDFLEKELQRVGKTLEQQEKAVGEFKQRYLEELPGRQEINRQGREQLRQQLQANLDAIEQARNNKALLGQRLLLFKSDEALTDSHSPVSHSTFNDNSGASVTPVEQELARRRSELAKLQAQFSDQYPEVKFLKQEVAELEARLEIHRTELPAPRPMQPPTGAPPESRRQGLRETLWRETEEQIRQADFQEQKLLRDKESLRRQLNEYEEKITNAPLREQELMILTRDYESTRKNYDSLLAGQMQAKVAENLEKRQKAEQFKVLDPAPLPILPWKPDRRKFLIMALVLGFGAGCGAVCLAEYLDSSFHDLEELKQVTALPVLAVIPFVTSAAEQRQQQVKRRYYYAACIVVSVATIAAVYFFWLKVSMAFSYTIQLLKPV
jgi:polysaccharide chain length determinant protein (PEP-CTERM system associated)